MTIKYKQIVALQKAHNVYDLQQLINTGEVWKFEGSYGRAAMAALEDGACMLPKKRHRDYYGQIVPARTDLKAGAKGTFLNCARYWENYLINVQ